MIVRERQPLHEQATCRHREMGWVVPEIDDAQVVEVGPLVEFGFMAEA